MPYQYTHKTFTKGGTPIPLVEGKETIVAQAEGIDVGPTNGSVLVDAVAVMTTVAETSEIIVRIRRTNVTGTEVAKVTVKPGASTILSIPIEGEDKPGESSGLKYVLTVEDVAKKVSESKGSTIEVTW